MSNRLLLSPRHRRILEVLLREHFPNVEVWACGSRVNDRGHEGSDLDLVLRGPGFREIPLDQLDDFEDAVRESDIPFLVEARDWARLPERLRRKVERGYTVMTQCTDLDSTRPEPDAKRAEFCAAMPFDEAFRINPLVSIKRGTPTPFVKMAAVNPRVRTVGPTIIREFRGSGSKFRNGDTLLARITPCLENGKIAQYWGGADQEVGHGSTEFIVIRGREGITDSDYAYYVTRSDLVRSYAIGQMTGTSGRQRVPVGSLARLDVAIPPLPEQRAITHVLGTLDDKIELNRRMNEMLEAIARALFKSWFVDFDPVRAKMEGRETGLPKFIADLFPNRLVDSEMGKIPEGWEVSEIGKEVKAVGGATPSTKKPSYWDQGRHCWATPKDLSKLNSPVLLETSRKITDAGLRKISSGTLPVGTVLLSSRAPIGYLAITEVPTAVNQGFIAMICDQRLPNLYVLRWCARNLGHIKNIAGGSTFAEISKKVFRPVPVLVPPAATLGMYERLSQAPYERLVANTKECVTLGALRNILLPKLISGEIRVPRALSRP